MNSFLKSGFLLGLGAAVAGKEKFDESIMKLVEKGSMTQTEADTIFDELFRKGEGKSDEWNQEFKEMVKVQLNELGFVTREELDVVKAQLILVQQEIAQMRNKNLATDLDQSDPGINNIPPGFSKNVK
jgi:polyhydroxyalkanoate synthesis regulator phasin